ncbi:MAG: PQQ-dependent dehydrogenase, methanol/ethanol family [Gammaproteobacteria bacterium]|nr:PQQ-dependent dehydrogenase, methanol/ethanol family [Gammaproteobacteria bacterium]
MNLLKLTASLFLFMWVTTPAAYSDTGDVKGGKQPANVDDKRLLAAAGDGANWLSYGRTYDEQRFSPLTAISDKNVGRLGLQWSADLDTARGQEATPIVVDGVLYVSTAWSMVKAFDAATGEPIWSYDPQVPREKLVEVCCDAVNRGVAVYKGKVFVGTLAGHVVALDAATGKVAWDIQSIPEGSHMAITGAPRIVKGKVLIGAAGSEYFTRGYLAAFDTETGKEVWRFYTVPGDPSQPFEGKHLEAAAKTWSGEYWKFGGGGTVWDSITYDPETDLVYFGTANAEPWNPGIRNSAAGDNLYTASIVAIRPDTGEYVWHYQETPEDRWDFDSNQQIIAANLKIAGQERRVVMHAPKNGFFYVLDARTGKFISGTAFATVNWATGLDPASGRPLVNPEARYEITGKPFTSFPGAYGAHTWHPMSYSPDTGLVYIPTNEAAATYTDPAKEWTPGKVGMQLGVDFNAGAMPADTGIRESWLKKTTGALLAWDPVTRSARWAVQHAGPANGGTLSTAGNLVFQGTAGGEFRAYAADTGKQLWSFAAQTGVVAGPVTYSVNGKQYVAVLAGWGTLWDLYTGILSTKSGRVPNVSRLLVFALDGKDQLPPPPPHSLAVLDPPPVAGDPGEIADGALSFHYNCSGCHGDAAIAGVLVPDLRHSAVLNSPQLWQQIVHDGILKERGMVAWSANMTPAQIENIRLYVIKRANEDRALELGQAKDH